MKGRICVVTGANSGIGKVTALELAKAGARVVMVCRNPERGAEALEEIRGKSSSPNVELMIADLASFDSLRSFREEFAARHDVVDVLVNNAGLYVPTFQESEDGHELSFAVNHLGTYMITMSVMEQLKAADAARVVVVSSAMHRLGDKNVGAAQRSFYHGMLAYADAKLANILFTYELARLCKDLNITANCVHPGVVRTGFGADYPGVLNNLIGLTRIFYSSPERGARGSVFLASDPSVKEITGRDFVGRKRRQSSRASRCPDAASRLWKLSADLTGMDLKDGIIVSKA